jgi:hypothetical protein
MEYRKSLVSDVEDESAVAVLQGWLKEDPHCFSNRLFGHNCRSSFQKNVLDTDQNVVVATLFTSIQEVPLFTMYTFHSL